MGEGVPFARAAGDCGGPPGNTSAISPATARRVTSICHMRSCGDVTLGKEEVVEVGRAQMWDAMSVAHYVHRFMQAAQGEGSIQLRQRILGGVPKPESKNNDGGKK